MPPSVPLSVLLTVLLSVPLTVLLSVPLTVLLSVPLTVLLSVLLTVLLSVLLVAGACASIGEAISLHAAEHPWQVHTHYECNDCCLRPVPLPPVSALYLRPLPPPSTSAPCLCPLPLSWLYSLSFPHSTRSHSLGC